MSGVVGAIGEKAMACEAHVDASPLLTLSLLASFSFSSLPQAFSSSPGVVAAFACVKCISSIIISAYR